jgi:hypothetical protein
MHGAGASQVRAKAQARQVASKVKAEAGAALAYEGLAGIDDPLEVLGRVAAEALAMKDALAARVNALTDLRSPVGVEQLRVEVALYERALDRSAKFLDLLARSDFRERQIELQQAQASIVVQAFQEVLSQLRLSPGDHNTAIRVFLRAIGFEGDLGDGDPVAGGHVVVRGELG